MINFLHSPSWYLFSLVIWRMVSSFLVKKCKYILLLSIICAVITFVIIPKYGGYFSIMRTFQFYPFFVIGYVLKGRLSNIKKYNIIIIILGITSCALILLTSCRLQHVIFFQRDGLYSLAKVSGQGYLYTFCYRYLMLALSVLFSAFILLIFYNNQRIQRVAEYGQYTLFIYFGQTLLYPVVTHITQSFIMSLCISFAALMLLTFLSQKPFSKILMNPISTLISKLNNN